MKSGESYLKRLFWSCMETSNILRRDGRFFLFVSFLLTMLGLVFIYSSSSVYALEKFGSAHYFLVRHTIALFFALVAFFLCALVPIRFFKKYSPYFFFFSLFLTILTLLPFIGLRVHGSTRWLRLLGYSFQPSELLKVFFVMYIGFFIDRKSRQAKGGFNPLRSLLYVYLPFILILLTVSFVLLKQPDFGAVVTLLVTSLVLFFVADFRMVHLMVTLAAVVPIGVALICSRAYRLNRILIFLNPWADRHGRGFQIIQSLIAIGSGKLWGVGISNSKQKFFYLPMQHTDFIFPIIAEETGFVGSIILLSLYFLFCYFGIRIVTRLKNPFAMFTSLGFVVLISIQAVMNLMVTTGLLPTKGLGLPFISHGGTSLLCSWAMVGLIINFLRAQIFENGNKL